MRKPSGTPSTATDVTEHVIMPPLKSMCSSIALQVVESTMVPAFIFWSVLHLGGLVWALFSGLGWCYLALARRWARGKVFPAVLVIATLLFTMRTGVALAFHSAFVYLLTPTLNAFLLAAVFLGSVLVHRPLTARFAKDFIHLPAHVVERVKVQAALRQLCLVWALVNVINGGVALQLLMAEHIDAVMLTRSVMAPALTACAVTYCVLLARKVLKAEGMQLHLRWTDTEPAAA